MRALPGRRSILNTLPVGREAGDDQERGRVEEDIVADGLNEIRSGVDREEGDEVCRVVERRATRDSGEAVDGEDKVGGWIVYSVIIGDDVDDDDDDDGTSGSAASGWRALHLPHVRVHRDGDLVEEDGHEEDAEERVTRGGDVRVRRGRREWAAQRLQQIGQSGR